VQTPIAVKSVDQEFEELVKSSPAPNKRSFLSDGRTWVIALLLAVAGITAAAIANAEDATPIPQPPADVTVESIVPEDTEAAEPQAQEEPSRFSNALRYLFKDDSTGIVSEAEADYKDRVAELDAKEAQLTELEQILQNEEQVLSQDQQEFDVKNSALETRIKALTKCVAGAMDTEVSTSEP